MYYIIFWIDQNATPICFVIFHARIIKFSIAKNFIFWRAQFWQTKENKFCFDTKCDVMTTKPYIWYIAGVVPLLVYHAFSSFLDTLFCSSIFQLVFRKQKEKEVHVSFLLNIYSVNLFTFKRWKQKNTSKNYVARVIRH